MPKKIYNNKKFKVFLILLILIILAGSHYGLYLIVKPKPKPNKNKPIESNEKIKELVKKYSENNIDKLLINLLFNKFILIFYKFCLNFSASQLFK